MNPARESVAPELGMCSTRREAERIMSGRGDVLVCGGEVLPAAFQGFSPGLRVALGWRSLAMSSSDRRVVQVRNPAAVQALPPGRASVTANGT